MEDAVFLSILVGFAIYLNTKSLSKSLTLMFSFLSPIICSFMSLFLLSTKTQLYSLALLAYAVGLGTNNLIISALVLIIFFMYEVYRSSNIEENIVWICFFIIMSASYWLKIDAFITYTPILLYAFVEIEKESQYQSLNDGKNESQFELK